MMTATSQRYSHSDTRERGEERFPLPHFALLLQLCKILRVGARGTTTTTNRSRGRSPRSNAKYFAQLKKEGKMWKRKPFFATLAGVAVAVALTGCSHHGELEITNNSDVAAKV